MIVERALTEKQLQSAIIEMAKLLGWRVMHQRPGRTADGWRTTIEGHAGFPDLVLLRPPRLLFVELKSVRGKLGFEQSVWLNGLRMVSGVETYEWRPADWESDDIEGILR